MAKSHLSRVANATITFINVKSTKENPNTGNQEPDDIETLTVDAFFHKASISGNEFSGVPIGSIKCSGYTIGELPAWAKFENNPTLDCTWKGVGSGKLKITGSGYVVKSQVGKLIRGTQIDGYLTFNGT